MRKEAMAKNIFFFLKRRKEALCEIGELLSRIVGAEFVEISDERRLGFFFWSEMWASFNTDNFPSENKIT